MLHTIHDCRGSTARGSSDGIHPGISGTTSTSRAPTIITNEGQVAAASKGAQPRLELAAALPHTCLCARTDVGLLLSQQVDRLVAATAADGCQALSRAPADSLTPPLALPPAGLPPACFVVADPLLPHKRALGPLGPWRATGYPQAGPWRDTIEPAVPHDAGAMSGLIGGADGAHCGAFARTSPSSAIYES